MSQLNRYSVGGGQKIAANIFSYYRFGVWVGQNFCWGRREAPPPWLLPCIHNPTFRTFLTSQSLQSNLILQNILRSHIFLTSPKLDTQDWQWHGVKQIKPIFEDRGKSGTRVRGTTLLSQVVFISFLYEQFYKNTKPIFAQNLRTNKEQCQPQQQKIILRTTEKE